MKHNVNKLHVQRSLWRENNKNALCWAFYFVNDNKKVLKIAIQTMHCILCHSNPILNLNPKTQARKGLIIYNTINGIIALRKHVNSNHSNVLKKFEEANFPFKEEEIQVLKIDQIFLLNSISSFFFCKRIF
jgi:hypothetical protein